MDLIPSPPFPSQFHFQLNFHLHFICFIWSFLQSEGVDLNRRWSNPDPQKHPTVYHTKRLLGRFKKVGSRDEECYPVWLSDTLHSKIEYYPSQIIAPQETKPPNLTHYELVFLHLIVLCLITTFCLISTYIILPYLVLLFDLSPCMHFPTNHTLISYSQLHSTPLPLLLLYSTAHHPCYFHHTSPHALLRCVTLDW